MKEKLKVNIESLKTIVMNRYLVRSKTNSGDIAKQYFKILAKEGMDTALSITKLILSEDGIDVYSESRYELLKTFKGMNLYRQVYSVKLKTLFEALTFFNQPTH